MHKKVYIDFVGTKVALINNGKVLAILRDDKPTINYPNMWDLVGGAREKDETAFDTAQREIQEELAINISQDGVIWEKAYPAVADPSKTAIFIVLAITDEQINSIKFGNEGQQWKMMDFEEFLKNDNAIPGMKLRLSDFLVAKVL